MRYLCRHLLTLGLLWKAAVCAEVPQAPLAQSIRYRKLVAPSQELSVHLVIFDPKRYTLRVIDNGTRVERPRFANLASALTANRCVAGINGGFFDMEEFRPSGLMIAGGRTLSAFDPKGWQKGVLCVDESGIALIDRDDFGRRSAVREALQSSPWLIRAGRVDSSLRTDMRRARRAFVGTSREGGCALGFSTAVTFRELAEVLLQQSLDGFTFAEALALDGATSSGFWCDIEGARVSEPELVTVRNFVGITARDAIPPPRIIERPGVAVLVSVVAITTAGIFWSRRRAKRSSAKIERG